MIALGVDPALRHTGLALLRVEGAEEELLQVATLRVPQRLRGGLAWRRLIDAARDWCETLEWGPHVISSEGQFVAPLRGRMAGAAISRAIRQSRDALDVARASGILLATAGLAWPDATILLAEVAEWRRAAAIPASLKRREVKGRALEMASMLWTLPEGSGKWTDHAAEAALIASWGAREALVQTKLREARTDG